jgi:hypothetical protein
MKPIQLISPVDGSVYAERMPLTAAGRGRRRPRQGRAKALGRAPA